VNIKVSIQIEGDEEDPDQSVYAPYFHVKKEQQWWIIIAEEEKNRVYANVKVPIVKLPFRTSLDFQPETPSGKFKAMLVSDSYIGCDTETKFVLE
jgi:pre-mRNA-splicing helicase BRR2